MDELSKISFIHLDSNQGWKSVNKVICHYLSHLITDAVLLTEGYIFDNKSAWHIYLGNMCFIALE